MTTRQELRVYLIAALIACVSANPSRRGVADGRAESGGVTALVATKLGATLTPTTLTLEGEAEAGINGIPRVVHYKSPFASPPQHMKVSTFRADWPGVQLVMNPWAAACPHDSPMAK